MRNSTTSRQSESPYLTFCCPLQPRLVWRSFVACAKRIYTPIFPRLLTSIISSVPRCALFWHESLQACWEQIQQHAGASLSTAVWFEVLRPIVAVVRPRTAGRLLFLVCDAAQQQQLPVVTDDVVWMIRLYSDFVKGSMRSTIDAALEVVLNGMVNLEKRVHIFRKRRALTSPLQQDVLDPARTLCTLSIHWGPDMTAALLHQMAAEEGSERVYIVISRMHQFTRYELIADVLRTFDEYAVVRVIHKIRAMNQLGPRAIAAYVYAVSRSWNLQRRQLLVESLCTCFHSELQANFMSVLARLDGACH